jgi:hypothetical protein
MSTGITPSQVPVYEELLQRDRNWAMDEGDRHFQRDDAVFRTLRKLTRRLDSLEIPYAVVGALALDAHGLRRLTIDVDVLVTRESLNRIHESLEGLGYVRAFTGSKHLRDTEHGVRVEFLVTGDFPGDGRPKPVSFPDPAHVYIERDGMRFLSLPVLAELKLASGLTNPGRLKDLADVQELIKTLQLDRAFAENLNPFVREKYLELWDGAQEVGREP